MKLNWKGVVNSWRALAPENSTGRKVIQLIAIVLLFQGLSIVILSSHFGPIIGVVSMAVGVLILAIFPPRLAPARRKREGLLQKDPYGIMLTDAFFRSIGGSYAAIALGIAIIVGTLLYNEVLSSQPEIGDLDLLSIILGGLLVAYPFTSEAFKVETCFALLFVAMVTVILVIPQALLSIGQNSSSGNWYVYYMLAAPFAGALNLLGIDAGANAEFVSITFNDGTVHVLAISAACAGLYSFSIFVSAFFSFVLVFEKLSLKINLLVLSIGLLIAYLGNLVRMTIIGVVGFYSGMDALLWAHDNIGWMVFLSWSSAFWFIVIRFVDRRERESEVDATTKRPLSEL